MKGKINKNQNTLVIQEELKPKSSLKLEIEKKLDYKKSLFKTCTRAFLSSNKRHDRDSMLRLQSTIDAYEELLNELD